MTARWLIACEESGTVRDAFLRAGIDAVSCDLKPTRAPGPHYQCDVRKVLYREEWAGIMTDAYATPRMAEIRSNLAQTWFAWSGATTNGSAAYFRVQGPTIVIEYAPQGGVDHIHTIYRDPTNDYGAKFTRR